MSDKTIKASTAAATAIALSGLAQSNYNLPSYSQADLFKSKNKKNGKALSNRISKHRKAEKMARASRKKNR